MKALSYIGAFLGGAIVGAAVGLLLAPEKGEDVRAKIADQAKDYRKNVTDYCENLKNKISHKKGCCKAEAAAEEA